MPWFRVDDSMWRHPKFHGLDDAAVGMWARMGSWCSDPHNLTEGFVPSAQWRHFSGDRRSFLRRIGKLENARLVVRDDEADGWWMHDYLDYNPSSERVETRRDQWKRAQAARRQRTAGTASRDDEGRFASSDDISARHPLPKTQNPSTSSTQTQGGGRPQAVDNSSRGRGRSSTDARAGAPRPSGLEQRTARRLDGTACPSCADVGLVEIDGTAQPCPQCR